LTPEPAIYKRTVFPNGLKVITEAIPHVRSISLGLWLNVGSRDEEKFPPGISHFIEHMVFKGTKTRNASEIASYLESVGGAVNAFTSREETCFYAKFLDEHLPMAVELLFDLVNNSTLDPADLEKEKKVILEEIKDIEDAPSDMVHDRFAQALFGSHPLGAPIQGSKASVKSITRQDVIRYMKKHHRPDRMIVAASGNLEHEKLVEIVSEYISSKEFKPSTYVRHKPTYKPIRKMFKHKSSQTHVCLGVPAIEFTNPKRSALLLANTLLGGGMSSRFFQHLREDLGLVYNVFSYVDYFQDTGVFGIYLGTDKKNVIKAINGILTELDRLINEPLSDSDLAKIKAQLKGNLMLGLENTSNRMNRLAKHELLIGRYVSLDETVSGIDSVTADEIVEISKKIFMKDRFTAVTLGPTMANPYAPLE
jgi:predicted Zn-dependent peptidase